MGALGGDSIVFLPRTAPQPGIYYRMGPFLQPVHALVNAIELSPGSQYAATSWHLETKAGENAEADQQMTSLGQIFSTTTTATTSAIQRTWLGIHDTLK